MPRAYKCSNLLILTLDCMASHPRHDSGASRSHGFVAEVKATETVGPVLIHIVTEKGRGYEPAETASDKMHGVGKYDPITGQQQKSKGGVSLPASSPLQRSS